MSRFSSLPARTAGLLTLLLVVATASAHGQKVVAGSGPLTSAAASGDRNGADASDGPAFTITVGSPTLTMKSVETATVAVTITPSNNFSGVVNLSCSGAPANTACGFAGSTVPVRGGTVVTPLTIATGVKQNTAANREFGHTLGVLACGLFGFGLLKRRRRTFPSLCLVLVLGLSFGLLNGCGDSSDTPAGTSTITITANGDNVHQTQSLQLVVQ